MDPSSAFHALLEYNDYDILAGINAIDLYNMQKTDYRNGLLCYKRAKTKHARSDEAYFEIRIEPIIQPIIEKYLAEPNDPYLFSFHKRYSAMVHFLAPAATG